MSETRSARRDLLLVALMGAILFVFGLANHDLWNPDEPRYAQVAREMRESGQFLVPHLNDEVYAHKPPLLFWLIAAVSIPFGDVTEWSARLPSAISAVVTLLLLFGLARRLTDPRVAWAAVAIFATSLRIAWQARVGQIDMLLICLVTLAMYLWVRGYLEQRHGMFLGFFFAAGFATLAKGPVGLLPPLLSVLVFLLWTRDWQVVRPMRIGRGLLVWAAIVLAWLVPAVIVGGTDYAAEIVFKQNVGRYANPWHHYQPWYYFLTVIPLDSFPWSLFLPTALWVGLRRLEGPARRAFLFGACWTLATVVFFSLSPAKRTVYVLTMYPGMALMVATALDGLVRHWPRDRRGLLWPVSLLTGFLLAIDAYLWAIPWMRAQGRLDNVKLDQVLERLGGYLPWGLAASLLPLLLAALLAMAALLRGRPRVTLPTLAAGAGVSLLLLLLLFVPRFDEFKSARELSEVLVERMRPGETYAMYPRLDPPYVFYSRRFAEELTDEQQLRAFAARPGRVWLITEERRLRDLDPPLELIEVFRDDDLTSSHVLLSSEP